MAPRWVDPSPRWKAGGGCVKSRAMLDTSAEDHIRQLLASGHHGPATTALLRAVAPHVKRYLVSLLHDEIEAAEAFSMFAEAIWKGLPGFRGEASLRTWAFRVAWTTARAVRRSAWRRRHERLRTSAASRIPAESPTSSGARFEQQRSALDMLRASLSLRDRSLLELRIDQQLSWSEIAEILTTTAVPVDVTAVMKRFERLKQRLARKARQEGLLE